MPPFGVGSISFSGLASGLDTKALIEAILKAERRPIERLQLRESQLRERRSALDSMRSTLNDFVTSLRDLGAERTFRGRVASVSQEGFFTASAAAGAEMGVFAVDVQQLAQAHKVKSDAFASSTDAVITDGTVTIQSGSNDPITIDVQASSANNTLEAVRDAINDADAGVQASILFDGASYHLIVRAEETGAANALSITDTTNLNLDDPSNEIVAAQDARLTVDGLSVTSSSNQVSNVISGVTLNLQAVTGGTPVTLSVSEDVEGVVEAVQDLVDQYNEVMDFFNAQFDTENPGPLRSDGMARRIHMAVQSMVTGGVPGIPLGELRALSSIGVSFDGRSGRMSLDTTELRELLEQRFDDVGRLFVTSGSTTDPRIRYVTSSAATEAGDYAVEITQAAEQASLTGSAPIDPNGIKLDEILTITVGADTTTVNLTAGMTVSEIVSAVNTALDAAGLEATASDSGGALRIATDSFGSDQTLTVSSNLVDPGNGEQSGFDTTPATDTGQDVAGRIGGTDATGSGQLLTGASGGGFEGLVLRVTATAQDVLDTGGDFGTVSFSPGLTKILTDGIQPYTRLGDGTIDSAQEALDDDLQRIAADIDRFEERLARREATLVRMFTEAERAISVLQAQQAQLGGITG